MRKFHWQRKARAAAQVAVSLGKSLTTRQAKGFFYPPGQVVGSLHQNARGFLGPRAAEVTEPTV